MTIAARQTVPPRKDTTMHDQEHDDDVAIAHAAYRAICTITMIVGLFFVGQTVRSIGIMLGWWG